MGSRNALQPTPFGLGLGSLGSSDVEKALGGGADDIDEEEEDEMLDDEKFGAALAEAEAERREQAGREGREGLDLCRGEREDGAEDGGAEARGAVEGDTEGARLSGRWRMFAPVYNGGSRLLCRFVSGWCF